MILSRTYDTEAKARIAAYEAELQANASDVNWLADTQEKITVRAGGKAHPAWMHSRYGLTVACSCPGSKNGTLNNTARKVADGWEKANCCN